MRNHLLLLLLSVLFTTACTTDVPAPCGEDGPAGALCREYRYANGTAKGFVTYGYMGDSVVQSDYLDANSSLVKSITERLHNGRITLIAAQFPKGPSRIQTWHYNEMDSLWKIVHGANDSVMELTYHNGKRATELYFSGNELQRFFVYRYYQDDGELYRILAYNKDSMLLSYRQFESFSTGQNRVSYFTDTHQLLGRRVYRTTNGVVTSIQFTDRTGTITERTDLLYDAALNLTEITQLKGAQTFRSVFLYY